MKFDKLLLLILLAVLMLPALDARSQNSGGNLPNLILQPQKTENVRDHRILLVRQLISQAAYISAADLLEDMYSENPNNPEVFRLLIDCYMNLKAYPKAELFVLKKIETSPFDSQNHNWLLEVYLKSGVDSLVKKQVAHMLEIFPENIQVYSRLIDRLIKFNRPILARELIDKGRLQFKNKYLFAMEAATILQIKGNYYDAVWEYFLAGNQDTVLAKKVDRQMSTLIRYPGALPEIKSALIDILDSLPGNRYVLKTLQETYILGEQFSEAFDICIKLDSLTEGRGRQLFTYIKQCRERKLYQQVVDAADYLKSRDYKRLPYGDLKYYHAEALAGLGRYDEALAVYQDIFDSNPKAIYKAEALLKMGNIYRYFINDYEAARICYDSVISFYVIEPVNSSGWYERAMLYLVEGELEKAQAAFLKLQQKARNQEIKELVAYNLGLIEFYGQRYEDADLAFRKLIEDFPRGFYVNDALINSLIIGEAMAASPEALDLYTDALLYEIREKSDSVISSYLSIIDLGPTPLTGLSMYRLADYNLKLGDTTKAEEIVNSMEEKYSEDYFFPYCLKLRGDIFSMSSEKINEAIEIYKDILLNHPTYPFIGEVRRSLQKIQPHGATGAGGTGLGS